MISSRPWRINLLYARAWGVSLTRDDTPQADTL